MNGERLAFEGALDEEHLERMDEFALWALSPYQAINEAIPITTMPLPVIEPVMEELPLVPEVFEPVEPVVPVAPVVDPYLVVFWPELFDEEYPEVPLYRAFGSYADAKLYFEWQRSIGQEHAAIYDKDLARLE